MRWTLEATSSVPHWRTTGALHNARAAFSTRRGGVSPAPYDSLNLGKSTDDDPGHVAENRSRLLAVLGVAPDRLATAGQVHGADVTRVHAPGHHPACDALFTTEAGVALAVTTADCMSILYTSPRGVAAAHSGWRGTAAGMPVAALTALCRAT